MTELKTTSINNRRYLGSKHKLLPFIKHIVETECGVVGSLADIFAGTGAVAAAFTDKRLVTNDVLYSNYICHQAWFSSSPYSSSRISELISYYNAVECFDDNYMSTNFTDTYFAGEDCRKIGFIRDDIESRFLSQEISERERALLITSLLYGIDKIANTCGHYDAYRQRASYDRHLELAIPTPPAVLHTGNECHNTDANNLVSRLDVDLVYLDPPYNSRQYCDAYHLLENVARWEKPQVSGVARKMNRSALKSAYCTNRAASALANLVDQITARHILLSYNNMSAKGDGRSNAKISDDEIWQILSAKGQVKIFTQQYKPFSAGKSNISEHAERLFLCTVA